MTPPPMERIEEACTGCLRCVEDCASGVWRLIDGIPTPAAPISCNQCGHCLAVCPENAVINTYLDPSQARPVDKARLDPRVYREIVLSRRSVRRYQKKKVKAAVIKDIIDMARFSPTATNSQHVAYTVVTRRETLAQVSERVFGVGRRLYDWSKTRGGKLAFKGLSLHGGMRRMIEKYIAPLDYYAALKDAGKDLILHNAPTLILLRGPSGSFFASDNCHIAAANITNYAHALGLGTCFIGFLTVAARFDRKLRGLLEIPKGQTLYASLVMGYPMFSHPRIAPRKPAAVEWIE